MPNLMKACPKYCENVNVKKSVCDCGHTFVLKRKASINAIRKSKRIAMRSEQALESLSKSLYRLEQNRANMTKKTALESPDETMARCEQDRVFTDKKRALGI